jgi:carbonic anhydrase
LFDANPRRVAGGLDGQLAAGYSVLVDQLQSYSFRTQKEIVAMSVLPELLAANELYAAAFNKGELPTPPARKVAILVCMDARIDPAKALGLEEGDAHVIRNAGGRAADALRSLVISHALLGTREIVVIHHTDCGMLTFTNELLRKKLTDELGPTAGAVANAIDFLPFPDLDQGVRDDVAMIRSSPLIPKDIPVTGFVYDVRTGRLREVAAAPAVAIDHPLSRPTEVAAQG